MAGCTRPHWRRECDPIAPPRASAFGSLVHYITHADAKSFQPANITFDLLPPLEKLIRDRQERHRGQCDRALRSSMAGPRRSTPAGFASCRQEVALDRLIHLPAGSQ